MAVTTGRLTALGLGSESSYGTAVSRTNWIKLNEIELDEKAEYSTIPHLYQSGGADFADHYQARVVTAGRLRLPLLYEGLGMLLKTAMGASPSTTGSGPYQHTFNRGVSFASLTGEVVRGNSGNSEIINGILFPSWSMLFESGQIASVTAEILAQKANADRGAAGSPSFGGTVTQRAVLGHHVGQLNFNSANYTLQRLELAVNNKLARIEELGSLYTAQPEMSDFGEVRVRATLIHRGDALYNARRAGTQSDVTVSVTNGTDTIAITARNAVVVDQSEPISSAGVVTETVEWLAMADASDGALTFVITNGQSSATAN